MSKRTRYNESPTHTAYKKIAIDILKERGFRYFEIKEEYIVKYKVNGKIKYVVDIVGIKEDYKIAIECGGVGLSKLLNLRKFFDEVLVINPATVVEMYEYWKTKYFTETHNLKRKCQRIKKHAEWVSKDANNLVDPLKEEILKLESQVHSLKGQLRRYRKAAHDAWEIIEIEKKEQS